MKKYSQQHEWISLEGDIGIVGISNYAQKQLGDIVFADLPTVGKQLTRGNEAAVVESVKAASEVYTPVSGEIVEINTTIQSSPELINCSPEEQGWFFKIKLSDPNEVSTLMDISDYKTFIGE